MFLYFLFGRLKLRNAGWIWGNKNVGVCVTRCTNPLSPGPSPRERGDVAGGKIVAIVHLVIHTILVKLSPNSTGELFRGIAAMIYSTREEGHFL
jgi:hypothetical protein